MAYLSVVFNIFLFFLLINWSYLSEKRRNPATPERSLSLLIGLPVALGLLLTVVNRMFRVVFIYQIFIFLLLAGLIYWAFLVFKKK